MNILDCYLQGIHALAKEKNAKRVVILDVQIKSGCSSFKKKVQMRQMKLTGKDGRFLESMHLGSADPFPRLKRVLLFSSDHDLSEKDGGK